jgi:hypothetical protein
MAESAFGMYDWHLASNLCREASELAYQAREKLQAAYALFLADEDRPHTSPENAEKVAQLGHKAGELWVEASELGYI